MFLSKSLSVNKGKILTTANRTSSGRAVSSYLPRAANPATSQSSTVEASFGGFGGLGGGMAPMSGMSVNTFWSSEYQYMLTGLLSGGDPLSTDSQSLALMYRDIYLLDNTAGSAVDIQSTFPFSDFELRGLSEDKLKIFQESVDQLNLRRMMPEISVAYLTDGYFCGSLIFDGKSKTFLDTMIHDALSCQVSHSPFYNVDPEINVRVGYAVERFLQSGSVFSRRYLETLPRGFRELLAQGSFTLEPLSTLFIPRKTLTDRAYVSYLHRILPMYLIEKTLYRGTLTEAHRRQRAMTQISAGDDLWEPTAEELQALVQQYQAAEMDPLGGWVATRNSVTTTDLRPGGDFWRWTEMVDTMVSYKLRALGISESFLSGDASFAASESAYQTFLESQDAYRSFLTDKTFYSKIFPLIAFVNGFFKDPSLVKRSHDITPQGFLYNARNRANLEIPTVHWYKRLEADHEEGMVDMLSLLDERGIPVPLKMWMAAAGVDSDTLLKDLKDDQELREQLESYTGKSVEHDSLEDEDDFGYEEAGVIPTRSLAKSLTRRKVPILSREWGSSGDIYTMNRSGSGKKHVYNQTQARNKQNDHIIKAARLMKNPNYRDSVKKANEKIFGSSILKSVRESIY